MPRPPLPLQAPILGVDDIPAMGDLRCMLGLGTSAKRYIIRHMRLHETRVM